MAQSFSAACGPDALLQHLAELRRAVRTASGGLVFVAGPLVQRLPSIAELVRSAWPGVPACIVPAAGVLSERAEIEAESAASGLLWEGGTATPFAAASGGVAGALAATIGARAGTAVVFARPDSFAAEELESIPAAAPSACVIGGGTAGAGAIGIRASGELIEGTTTGLAITGLAPPIVEASAACRLLSGFQVIEEVGGGGLVLRAGGRSALDLLSACTADLTHRGGAPPLIFAALADSADVSAGRGGAEAGSGADEDAPRFLIRPIRGVDPARRAIMLGEGLRPGARIAFAVRDAGAARAGLEAAARRVARSALGAAPRFALYLSCAGRGRGLYGAADVEVRVLRQRFAELPIAGMHSAFEIVPWAPGQARLALYTGVLALFRAPS
jgi:small ligand-binding sensory domain FIST